MHKVLEYSQVNMKSAKTVHNDALYVTKFYIYGNVHKSVSSRKFSIMMIQSPIIVLTAIFYNGGPTFSFLYPPPSPPKKGQEKVKKLKF